MSADIRQVTIATVAIFAPFAPFLLDADKTCGKKFLEVVAEKEVAQIWDKVQAVWNALEAGFKNDIEAQIAVKMITCEPDDETRQTELADVLKSRLRTNPKLAQRLSALLGKRDKSQEEQAWGQLGRVWLAMGNDPRACNYFKKALILAQETGNRRAQASHLGFLGQIYLAQRDAQKAQEYFQQALTLAKEIADRFLEGRLSGSLGLVSSIKGDHQKALGFFSTAIGIAKEMGDWQGEASHLGGMGTSYKFLGLQSMPEQRRGYYDGEMISYPYEYLDTSKRMSYYHEAVRCFEQALGIASKKGDKEMQACFKANLAEVQALIANQPNKLVGRD